MTPPLRHLALSHQLSLQCPLRRLCSSTTAAMNTESKAEYGQRQYGSGSLSINNPGVGRNRILRTQAISGRSKSLTRGKINRHYHRSCHQLSPRANSVLPGDGGASGYQQVPPSTRGSSTTPPHSRPLFFSTALATTASDPISPPVSTEPTGSAFSTASGARPSQRAPGVPLNASGYEHEHGGDRLNGLHQQGRRVFSSVPSAEYHNELEFFSEQDEELLQALGQQAATALSLRDIHALCQSTSNEARILQARFLHREIPIRFAQRALELRNLPHGLSETSPVVEAAGWYTRIVRQLVDFPAPGGAREDERFADFLSSILIDQTCVPQALSRGVLELRERGGVGQVQRHRIDRILDNFFISRISLRFLVDTFISSKSNRPGYSGVIQSECSPVLVACKAAEDVELLCRNHMGMVPPIEVFGREEDTLTAVPSHIYYIIREVLKNSCRATVEHCRLTKPGQMLTPVKIIVARGKEDVTIKIMDEGGGIRRSDLQHTWSYMYSTAPKPMASQLSGVPLDDMSSMRLKEEAALRSASAQDTNFAFAGYGMGLPLSRLYARYFGGSLKLRPMEGYGTDAYLHMHRIKTNSEELLPNSLEETLRVMDDDGRVNVTSTRSWKPPSKDDSEARALIRSFG